MRLRRKVEQLELEVAKLRVELSRYVTKEELQAEARSLKGFASRAKRTDLPVSPTEVSPVVEDGIVWGVKRVG